MSSTSNKYNLARVVELAHLYLEESQQDRYLKQIEGILKYVNVLDKLDLTNVQPTTYSLSEPTLLRKDEVKPHIEFDLAKNAPIWEEDAFKVPQILES